MILLWISNDANKQHYRLKRNATKHYSSKESDMKNEINNMEEFFCKQFIKSVYQDRFFFELSSNKRRTKAIGRICHNMMDIINENKIVEVYNSADIIHLTDRLHELSKEKEGYCIGFFELDQKWADISEAISTGIQSNFGFAIVLSDGIACICEETDITNRRAVILHSISKFKE